MKPPTSADTGPPQKEAPARGLIETAHKVEFDGDGKFLRHQRSSRKRDPRYEQLTEQAGDSNEDAREVAEHDRRLEYPRRRRRLFSRILNFPPSPSCT
jgi:hypothetical protein